MESMLLSDFDLENYLSGLGWKRGSSCFQGRLWKSHGDLAVLQVFIINADAKYTFEGQKRYTTAYRPPEEDDSTFPIFNAYSRADEVLTAVKMIMEKADETGQT